MASIGNSRLSAIYRQRFVEQDQGKRERLWSTLCKHWFQRYIARDAIVLDLAAGHCEFINHIECGTKIAVDLNDDVKKHANPDVKVVVAWSHKMVGVDDESIDVVFVSNFFEHLPDKKMLIDTLGEIHRVLNAGGRLLILQPNIRFLNGEYWDFVDHYLPLTDRTLVEAVALSGFEPTEVRPRFLPYTTRGRIPQASWLVRLYLLIPIAQKLLGKQAFVVARKSASA
jgi:SAM-dependent methyltransferase